MQTLLDFEREFLDALKQTLKESPNEKLSSGRTHEEYVLMITGEVPLKRLRNIILDPDGFNIRNESELAAVQRFYHVCGLMLPVNVVDFQALAMVARLSYSFNE